MHATRSFAGQHEGAHGIDLAPMLDFVINLLIFFIITAVFVKESGLVVQRPTTGDSSAAPAQTISILGNGDVVIDGRTVDVRAVRANVERLRATEPSGGIVIVAESAAPTDTLVSVIDEIHFGGIYDITFSTTQ
jgi:biopolymer transport protein ExbD